ncbi:MAG: hypothetical protein ABR573_01240 [Candidatus Dormibacteria bacterium]
MIQTIVPPDHLFAALPYSHWVFGRTRSLPIPRFLPASCEQCGGRLEWKVVSYHDPVIRVDKVDHYEATDGAGHVHLRDGRGQAVEPAVENLAPDRSEFANSPQGPQPYTGFLEFVQQERAKAEALKAAQAKKLADAAAAAQAPTEAPAGA